MSCTRRSLVVVAAVALSLPACLAAPAAGDRDAPRLLGVEPALGAQVSPTAELRLRFDEPLDAVSLTDAIAVVPFVAGSSCSVDLACPGGRCVLGRCQYDPIDAAFLRDLSHPPLSTTRQRQLAQASVALADDDASVVVLRLARPLAARRLHALVLGPTIADRAGNPRSDVAERRDFATSGETVGRPALTLTSPEAGSTDLPINLARLVVKASQPLQGVGAGAFWLSSPSGERVELDAEVAEDICAGLPEMPRCLRLRPRRWLTPLTEWTLEATTSVRNGRGDPLFVGAPLRLGSGARADLEGPRLLQLSLRVADGCLLLSAQASEVTDLRVRYSWTAAASALLGSTVHRLGVRLPAQLSGVVALELGDLAGHRAPLELHVIEPPAVPRVVITELLPNPHGPEPTQEWVELLNASAEPVPLGGWFLDDGDDGIGVSLLPAVTLRPGARAVVVGARYDPASVADAPPASDALLLRLQGTLGELGLANRGESLALRDPQGRLVSSYGGFVPVQEESAEGRSIQRVDIDACDVPDSWALAPPSPGASSAP